MTRALGLTANRALLAAAALGAACAAVAPDPDAREASAHPLQPYTEHEECLDLAPGDRLDYRWQAQAPLAFEIRYRESHAVVAPLVREPRTNDSGVYAALLTQRYCLWWEAGVQGTLLDYAVRVRRAQ